MILILCFTSVSRIDNLKCIVRYCLNIQYIQLAVFPSSIPWVHLEPIHNLHESLLNLTGSQNQQAKVNTVSVFLNHDFFICIVHLLRLLSYHN